MIAASSDDQRNAPPTGPHTQAAEKAFIGYFDRDLPWLLLVSVFFVFAKGRFGASE